MTGVITTAAGTGAAGFSGENGCCYCLCTREPRRFVAFDNGGNLHVSEFGGNRVRRLNLAAKGTLCDPESRELPRQRRAP